MESFVSPIPAKKIWLARGIALAADAVQLGLLPFMAPGFLSPVNVALDVAVAAILTRLVGWHIAFLPGFIIEQIPFANLAPTWTLAVMIATRGKLAPAEPYPMPR